MTRHRVSDLVSIVFSPQTPLMDGQHNAQLAEEETEYQRSCIACWYHSWLVPEFILFSLCQHCNDRK